MLTRRFHGPNAVIEGERYGLYLLFENPHLINWIHTCYSVASHEFSNPNNAIFEYNLELRKVTQHTMFSKFISDLVYYSNIKNIPFDGSISFKSNLISFVLTLLLFMALRF